MRQRARLTAISDGVSSREPAIPHALPRPQDPPERFLKAGVYGVAVGEDLALMDIGADAYLCLPGGASGLGGDGSTLRLSGPSAAAVVEAGLGADQAGPAIRTPPGLPSRTLIHDTAPTVSLGDVLRGLGAVRDIRRALRGDGLRPILAVASDHDRVVDRGAVAHAAKTFWRLSPWLPMEGECLVRSAMLMSYLRRAGLSADWVFGVRLWPFAAHCWVQIDDLCLNDDIERLAAYTPIYCR